MSHCLAICGIRFQALTSVLGSIAISPYLFKLSSAHVQTVNGYTVYYLLSQLHCNQALIGSVLSITCLVTVHMLFSAPYVKHVMCRMITISHRTVKLLHIHCIDWLLDASTL